MQLQTHNTSEMSLAITSIALALGKIMEALIVAKPALEALSYLVAIIAGLVTIYYKFKRKN